VKEDEYLRDGITEDILTDLSKIKGLNVFPRTTVLTFRDQKATAAQVCQQLRADYALEGSLRRAGNRLRINAQLVDAATGFPVWSERYDREMSDIFEVQDEIAHKIAEALRITLTPQEQAALAAKPTENLQAYDLYLRGRSYARRRTLQDMEFALQMFENAVVLDPNFALAYAAIANGCAHAHYWSGLGPSWIERAQAASLRAVALSPEIPEVLVSQGWILYARGAYDDAVRLTRAAIARKRECEGAYYLLLRALFASGNYQQVAEVTDEALEASGTDYNVYVPILNALSALGKADAARNVRLRLIQALESHLREVPEDARARILLASTYAEEGRSEDAVREANLAMVLRPNEATVLYNAACTFCFLGRKGDAMEALRKSWHAGYKDADWTRRDPDLALLHGDPEFERLFPEKKVEG
jgi:non-specific serine/threonine protein kinase